MNTKENVRIQLHELSSDQITDIMCEFFTDGSNSWQSDVLWAMVETEQLDFFVDYMIDKIIAEVSVEDLVEGGWIDSPPRMVYVEWDTDGEDVDDLPSEVEIPYDVDEDDIADLLSDEFGYCVSSFSFE